MLVVTWQPWQIDSLEYKGASGIVENGVVWYVFNAAVDMGVLLAPAQLLVVEDAGGDNQPLFLDAVKFAGGDAGRILNYEFRILRFNFFVVFRFDQFQEHLAVA